MCWAAFTANLGRRGATSRGLHSPVDSIVLRLAGGFSLLLAGLSSFSLLSAVPNLIYRSIGEETAPPVPGTWPRRSLFGVKVHMFMSFVIAISVFLRQLAGACGRGGIVGTRPHPWTPGQARLLHGCSPLAGRALLGLWPTWCPPQGHLASGCFGCITGGLSAASAGRVSASSSKACARP